jgi:hypothetical protein
MPSPTFGLSSTAPSVITGSCTFDLTEAVLNRSAMDFGTVVSRNVEIGQTVASGSEAPPLLRSAHIRLVFPFRVASPHRDGRARGPATPMIEDGAGLSQRQAAKVPVARDVGQNAPESGAKFRRWCAQQGAGAVPMITNVSASTARFQQLSGALRKTYTDCEFNRP